MMSNERKTPKENRNNSSRTEAIRTILSEYTTYTEGTISSLPLIEKEQKILFINNYDSFVYNIVNYICTLSSAHVEVVPNTISLNEAKKINPDKIIISPGPGHPKYDTNNVIPLIHEFKDHVPILGVCLGHQAICEAFGDDPTQEYVGLARVGPMHGKISKMFHTGEGIFEHLKNPCYVVRYHSLAAKADLLPRELKVTGMADDGTIMAVQHRTLPIFGVQFHPESIMMYPYGLYIMASFLNL